MSGWIKLHRQIIDWEWYTDHNTFRVFLHLLLTANHKDKKYKGMELKAGTIVTSRDLLSFATGLSVRQVRTALDKLKTTNELTIKTSPQGTIIQIVNYVKYQIETNELTNERPTNDQQTTSNNNVKKERNIFKRPTIEEINAYCLQNNLQLDAERFVNYYDSNGWSVGKNKMKDWKAAVRNWARPKEQTEMIYDPLVEAARKLGYVK